MYILVNNFSGPAPPPELSFVLDVTVPLIDEGTSGTPIDLTGSLPYEGMLKTTASYYKVTGLVPNAAYSVELINMAGQGALEVFSDAAFFTSLCTSDGAGNFPESCSVNANGSGALYIQAFDGGALSSAGATYRVLVK